MAIHTLEADTSNLHGGFNPALEPVLTIDPGDTVRFRTLAAGWQLEPARHDGGEIAVVPARPGIPNDGHALIGPVAIRGAEPGMTLAIRIERMVPGLWGSTYAGGWDMVVNHRFGIAEERHRYFTNWELAWDAPAATGIGRSEAGIELPLRPFFGVIGMPPPEPGWHPTDPPRRSGGNIDCAELVAGSTLYLPIELDDGLVSVGDGHALQADGEASGTAIECPMELGELTFDLLPGQPLPNPWAETPAGTITFGFDEDLDEAMLQALEGMVTLLKHRHGLETQAALALCSLVVDLRITQVVNGVKGVHALLKPDAVMRIVAGNDMPATPNPSS